MSKKAIIAMSGGVDSSVAAYLMKKQGFECVGITLKLYENDDIGVSREKTCCSIDDVNDARSVATRLDMPFYVFNFRDDFVSEVIDRFVCSYEKGETPNPCIECNRYIKFEKLYRRMQELGFNKIVTGHYARVEYDEGRGRYLLKKAVDDTKDQSYVLYNLTKEQLAHIEFPLGGMRKENVREIAEENGFVNARKRDSQDICFVPDGDYAAFIERHTGKTFTPGNFIDRDGNVLGKHKGIIHYTIGQRKGLGLALPCPMYVLEKSTETNTVTLGYNEDLFSDRLTATDVNLISVDSIDEPMRVEAKVRYSQKAQPATVTTLPDGRLSVVFDQPQRAITRGQAVVLYSGDIVVGGGKIE